MPNRTAPLLITLMLGMLVVPGCANTRSVTSTLPQPTTLVQGAASLNAPSATTQSSSGMTAVPAAATPEQAVAPEQNPVGDIPDTQAFVPYAAATGGYALDVPEGWARTIDAANVRFESKLDGLSVLINDAASASTAASAADHEVAALVAASRAMTVTSIKDVTLPAGSAVLVASTANSNPDSVTNKQVRLEQNSYLFFKDGKLATLTLWAPLGADNVDQWQRIANSFRWM